MLPILEDTMWLICTASSGHNRALARTLEGWVDSRGMQSSFLDLTEIELPLFTPARDQQGPPPALLAVEALFREATAFVFCAPEYNGSTPPTLSNTIAWLSTQGEDFRSLFNGKPAVIATRSGGGGQKVLLAMRQQLSHIGCNVVGRELLTTSKKPLNEASAQAVLEQLERLAPAARARPTKG
jgi:NAD(P)H-dependent FMN reductase